MLRARIESVLALAAALLAAVTVVWPAWLEAVSPLEPDAGTGEAEWWIVLVLALGAVVLAILAGRDYRAERRRAAEPA